MLAQLRLVATRQRCFDPFVAWWSLCRTSQRDRRAAGRSEAEAARRRRRLATDRLESQAARLARLDRALRRVGARAQLAARLADWRCAATVRGARGLARRWRARRYWQRWCAAAAARRHYVARPAALASRTARARAMRRVAAAAELGAWRGARAARHGAAHAWARWRARARGAHWAAALEAAAAARRRARPLEAALLRWWRAGRRRARAAVRRAAATLAGVESVLWAGRARRALSQLAAADDALGMSAALAALGGEWRGERAALRLTCDEVCRQHGALVEQRAAAAQAAAAAASGEARAESLLDALEQQQALLG